MRYILPIESVTTALLLLLTSMQVSAQWYTSQDSDEMTGESSSYANSKSVTATEPMDFPYNGTEAWFGVGCNGESEWVYVGFSESPNLTNTTTHDRYNTIDTRIKFDDNIQNITLKQDWGDKFLHFYNDSKIIPKLMRSNNVLLELEWHGEGSTYFRFSLDGSADAISKIRQECSAY